MGRSDGSAKGVERRRAVRARLVDVLAYGERAAAERRATVHRMVEIADEADTHERTATSKRSA